MDAGRETSGQTVQAWRCQQQWVQNGWQRFTGMDKALVYLCFMEISSSSRAEDRGLTLLKPHVAVVVPAAIEVALSAGSQGTLHIKRT